MLAGEIPVEETKILLWKQQQFPSRQQTGFFLANQQGIPYLRYGFHVLNCLTQFKIGLLHVSDLGKGQYLPCRIT